MKTETLRLVTFGGIGDVILTTPALREWKRLHPKGRIIVYCAHETHRDVLRENPHIDTLKSWRNPKFLPPFISKLLHRSSVYPIYSNLFPSISYRVAAPHIIAEMIGLGLENAHSEVFLTEAEIHSARQRLHGLNNPIALHLTPGFSQNKQWPLQNYESLIRACPDYTFVQIGMASEQRISGSIDLRGLPLRDSFATLQQCTAFVGPDSGLAHAAGAFKMPAIVLFGPSNPVIWGHTQSHNIYKRLRCSPCIDVLQDGKCPYNQLCMNSITVDEVKSALSERIRMS